VRSLVRTVFVCCLVVPTCVIALGSSAHAADPDAGVYCAGDTVTVNWTQPADTTSQSGYRVDHFYSTGDFSGLEQTTVGLGQTSVTAVLRFTVNNFIVWPLDETRRPVGTPLTTKTFTAGKSPTAATWQLSNWRALNAVGDRSATVSFGWFGPITFGVTGNEPDTLAISGAGRTTTVPNFLGVGTATFNGLVDGRAYTFTSNVSNACGNSEGSVSPTFVPGVAPAWRADRPPLTGHAGFYLAHFRASGKPAPTYALSGAPSWLRIGANGFVVGKSPKGTTRFSYSVRASNGVGIHPFTNTDLTAGPFTATMKP